MDELTSPPLYLLSSPLDRICFWPSFNIRRCFRLVNGASLGSSISISLLTGENCFSKFVMFCGLIAMLILSSSSSSISSASSMISRLSWIYGPRVLATKLIAPCALMCLGGDLSAAFRLGIFTFGLVYPTCPRSSEISSSSPAVLYRETWRCSYLSGLSSKSWKTYVS